MGMGRKTTWPAPLWNWYIPNIVPKKIPLYDLAKDGVNQMVSYQILLLRPHLRHYLLHPRENFKIEIGIFKNENQMVHY